jgi:hypothetical protein
MIWSVAGRDVNMEAEVAMVLGAITKQFLVKTQERQKSQCVPY